MSSPLLLAASRSPRLRRMITTAPVTRGVVDRFVPGARLEDALAATAELTSVGLRVTIDHLGEDIHDLSEASRTRESYVVLLDRLAAAGLAPYAEVSVKLSALGRALPGDGPRAALEHARAICTAAAGAGTTVTLDMEDHTTVDATLAALADLRADFPWVGAVLQSALRRTEADCRDLAHAGSRVRLVKGAYAEPASVAHTEHAEVDLAYVRCLRILMEGEGYPMVASHDPRMIALAGEIASRTGRDADGFEYQMLYGIRADEQRRLAGTGARMRVYLPYGEDWYGYFMRRLAERPANVAFFLRALVGH